MGTPLKIFLSSTKIDLDQVRANVIKFLGVLKSDIISMEIFGSDETRPVDYSLRKVRECNMFIGIYAEKYGTVDKTSDKSITELEYIEAYKMLQKNSLKGLLLYSLDPEANWPVHLVDRDAQKVEKLSKFKETMQHRHTLSFFRNVEDLPLIILRDVIRKIGIGTEKVFTRKSARRIKRKSSMTQPVGMEYYGEELGRIFFGREAEVDALLEQVIKNKMSLLIGMSGIGKTSLVNAGLVNRVKAMGWHAGVIRPLTEPVKNLRQFLWDEFLEGVLPAEFDLADIVNAISVAYENEQVLIVIDQFEDMLWPGELADIERVRTNLLRIYKTGGDNVRMLVTYRGDVESKIGTIWQVISGSPRGLPRYYLGPLQDEEGKTVLESTLKALNIRIKERDGGRKSLVATVLSDLKTESFMSGHGGIYPPFMQMVLAHMFDNRDKNSGYYQAERYYSAGQSKRIIADYLMKQMEYLGADVEVGKAILIALVSSYGTKTQKTVGEVARESLIPEDKVEAILRVLVDLRLVRLVSGMYEIAHDFLAKIITSELVSVEEREAKKAKDLLASRVAVYGATHAGLTWSEHLYIYRYRNKFLFTEDEVKLLLQSYLLGNGPIWYWARNYSKSKLVGWTKELLAEGGDEIQKGGYEFLIKIGEKPDLAELANVFSDYKDQDVLAKYIRKFATVKDVELLIKLNRKRAEEVVRASQAALVGIVGKRNKSVLEKMARSNSRNTMRCFEEISRHIAKELPVKELRGELIRDHYGSAF